MTKKDTSQIKDLAGYHSLLLRRKLWDYGPCSELKELLIGDEYVTVIIFYMALYEKTI